MGYECRKITVRILGEQVIGRLFINQNLKANLSLCWKMVLIF